jgi:murein DD-endopeptidase MepM/ murein hydrolase activator NlpD
MAITSYYFAKAPRKYKLAVKFYLSLLVLLTVSFAYHLYSRSINLQAMGSSQLVQALPSIMLSGQKKEVDNIVDLTVKKGDTFMSLLINYGFDSKQAYQITQTLKKKFNPAKLNIGHNIKIIYDNESASDDIANFYAISISVGKGKTIEILNKSTGFEIAEIAMPMKRMYIHTAGEIKGSLMSTARSLGIPAAVMSSVIKAYSYDVDFQRDIHKGDKFDIIYETYYFSNDKHAKYGDVLYIALDLGGRKIPLYKYNAKNDDLDYFTVDGRSVKKEFLRTPINATRISSKFGMRKHPTQGYSKMHKGVDFAAPIGTPIFAAANGHIEEMGWKGAYGNYIRIKHSAGYSTAYAHISRFNKNVKKGQKIKQGTVIAYVGSTGRSTGAHLHYEVLINNKHVNPLSVKSSPGKKLVGKEYHEFAKFAKKVNNIVSNVGVNKEFTNDFFDNKYAMKD